MSGLESKLNLHGDRALTAALASVRTRFASFVCPSLRSCCSLTLVAAVVDVVNVQIAKPSEVADLKRRSTVLVTSDAAGLMQAWRSRLHDGEAEFYSGKAVLTKCVRCLPLPLPRLRWCVVVLQCIPGDAPGDVPRAGVFGP